MSKLLANQISNYNDNGPVEVKDGVNIPTGKPLQVAGGAGTSGQYLTSTGSSIAWSTLPSIPAAQVQTDWNASGTIAEILNKPTLATVATSGSYTDLLNTPTIPSAQVQSDWNASGTLAEILNKPTLFSGSYNDLTDKPTIPSAQIQSDWNQSTNSALDFIKNKPALFSGSYTDLSNKPTIPANLSDLSDVSSTAPNNNEVLKWNGTNWAPATDATGGGGGGSTTFLGLTDTPANFTSQAGKYLKVNAGATALEYVDPIETGDITFGGHLHLPDGKQIRLGNDNDLKIYHDGVHNFFVTTTHTTYYETPYFVLRGPDNTTDFYATFGNNDGCKFYWNHSLKLSTQEHGIRIFGGIKDKDNQLGTAGQILSTTGGATAELDWIDAPSGGGATVTTDDSAPSSPSDGDLWWKSDEGRLKVYYADANSSQWVDASPPANTDIDLTSFTGHILPATHDQQDIGSANKKIRDLYLGSNSLHLGTVDITESSGKLVLPAVEMTGHFIPDTNAAYDLGNAEYKIRHLFLSDNTMYFQGDFLKVAQHNSGGSAQSASYLIPLAKLKDALNASANYEAFKAAILAITDAS